LPARDAALTVAAAVGSLLEGSFGDIEVIAVDDGSRDETGAVLAGLAENDPRLRVLRTTGVGIVGALVAAHGAAAADLIARQDADDRSHPDRLAAQVSALDADPTLAAVGCGFRWFCDDGDVSPGLRRYQDWQNGLVEPAAIRAAAFVECPVAHPTLVLRRSALVEVGGWRDPGWAEDYDLLLRLLIAHGRRIGKVDRPLYEWRDHARRLTHHHPAYGEEAFQQARVEYLRRHVLDGAGAVEVWGWGTTLARWRRSLEALGIESRAVELNPRRLRAGGTAIPPERLPEPSGLPLLLAFGTERSRDLVRRALTATERVDGRDFWQVG